MYNLFTYSQDKLQKRQKFKQQQLYNAYFLRHQNYKNQAQINRKIRLDQFIDIQNSTPTPLVIPDEYMPPTPKYHKNQSHIFNRYHTKTPPLPQMNQNHRESKIADAGRSRKKQSEQLTITKEDMKFLFPKSQPKIGEDKISESAMSFNFRADKLMQQYQQAKSKFDNVKMASRNRYRLCQITHFQQKQLNPQSSPNPPTKTRLQQQSSKASLSVYFSEIGEQRLRSKTYFKLAKTTQLLTTDSNKKMKLNALLSRSHYDRIKKNTASTQFTQLPEGGDRQSMTNSVMIP